MDNIIFTHFPDLTDIQKSQFSDLSDLYEFWNAQINVVSRKDMNDFLERHVLHSLGIAKIMNFEEGTKVLDVGTGGGFPGIPLAILFPKVDFFLVDSIGKKINNRYRWLILNLATTFLASSVVLLYQDTLDTLTILAIYMPVIAGMGGNAATQSFAIMVRGITLGTVSLKNAMPAIWRYGIYS